MTVKTRNRIFDALEYTPVYLAWHALLPTMHGGFSMTRFTVDNIRRMGQ